jgi:uncharacterized membrane protein YphA (DoxX/SURF4 family)
VEAIMSEQNHPGKLLSKRVLLLITGAACVGCCALPLASVVLGSGLLVGLAWWVEAAVALLVLAVSAAAIYWRWGRNKVNACKLDGRCQSSPE